MNINKQSYTIEEAAKLCQTSIWTLHRRIKEGTLKIFKAGGKAFRIEQEELIRFMTESRILIPPELSVKSSESSTWEMKRIMKSKQLHRDSGQVL